MRSVNPESSKYLGDYIHICTLAHANGNAIAEVWGSCAIVSIRRFWRFLTALWSTTAWLTACLLCRIWCWMLNWFGNLLRLREEQSLPQPSPIIPTYPHNPPQCYLICAAHKAKVHKLGQLITISEKCCLGACVIQKAVSPLHH